MPIAGTRAFKCHSYLFTVDFGQGPIGVQSCGEIYASPNGADLILERALGDCRAFVDLYEAATKTHEVMHGIYSSHDPTLPISIIQMNRLREPIVTYALKAARVVEHRVGPWHNDDSSFTMERLVIRYSGFTRTDTPPVKQRAHRTDKQSADFAHPIGESVVVPSGKPGVLTFVDTEEWVGGGNGDA